MIFRIVLACLVFAPWLSVPAAAFRGLDSKWLAPTVVGNEPDSGTVKVFIRGTGRVPPELRQTGPLSSADSSVTLVPPRQLGVLPEGVRDKLESCGCRIPQVYAGNRLNVVTGEFEHSGQLDWAVLCSRRGASTIYVFWGGRVDHVSRLATRADQPTPDEQGRICYPRAIRIGGAERVQSNYRPANLGLPNPTHDVLIDDVSSDESETLYWRHDRRWVKFLPR